VSAELGQLELLVFAAEFGGIFADLGHWVAASLLKKNQKSLTKFLSNTIAHTKFFTHLIQPAKIFSSP